MKPANFRQLAESLAKVPLIPEYAIFDWYPDGGIKTTMFGDTRLTYHVPFEDGSIELIKLYTRPEKRGKQSANVALKAFLAEADQLGMTVKLSVGPDQGIDPSRLIDFYSRQGFEIEDGTHMIRHPQTTLTEADMHDLNELVKFGVDMPDADFWITRRGTPEAIGEPKKTFNKEAFGVKVIRTDVLLPEYFYYLCLHVWMKNAFRSGGHGVTRLVTLRLSDVKAAIVKTLMPKA